MVQDASRPVERYEPCLRPGGAFEHQRVDRRKVRKKSLQAEINAEIVAAAGLGPAGLICTVSAHLPQMRLVNLSTSMHRLAKLDVSSSVPVWRVLIDAVACVLKETAGPDERLPRALSTVTWSLATVQLPDLPLLELMVPLAVAHLPHFKAFELATFLWSLAKLGAVDPVADVARPAFLEAWKTVVETIESYEFRSLAMLVWAYAEAGVRQERLLASVAARMRRSIGSPSCGCSELASVAWAFGKLGFRHEELSAQLADFALRRLRDFRRSELLDLFMGLAASGAVHEELFVAVLGTLGRQELSPRQLAELLRASARLMPLCSGIRDECRPLVQRCIGSLGALDPEELSLTVRAVAKLFGGRRAQSDCSLPGCAAEFLLASASRLAPHLGELSDGSLENIATVFAMLGLGSLEGTAALVESLEREALVRERYMPPPQLVSMLCAFLVFAPGGGYAVSCLAARLAGAFHVLLPCERLKLARVYLASEELPDGGQRPNDLALYEWCCRLSSQEDGCSDDASSEPPPEGGGGDGGPDGASSERPPSEGTSEDDACVLAPRAHTLPARLGCGPSGDELAGHPSRGGPSPLPWAAACHGALLVKNTFLEVADPEEEADRVRLQAKKFSSEQLFRKPRAEPLLPPGAATHRLLLDGGLSSPSAACSAEAATLGPDSSERERAHGGGGAGTAAPGPSQGDAPCAGPPDEVDSKASVRRLRAMVVSRMSEALHAPAPKLMHPCC